MPEYSRYSGHSAHRQAGASPASVLRRTLTAVKEGEETLGFRHGQHLSLDPAGGVYPLPCLFVSLLQRMGCEDEEVRVLHGHYGAG